ncbi:minichromosome maintenance protein 10 [Entomortierella parvispora]|uniref:Minichromosome maintenance protein 10 n=1 Tax=Entomortierella parvispora TaxID=205924 RepID=A0A9P3LTI5_9FUNG|nr:minichromosome maintenance protein 10 [Entomortierella parvispora]
MLTNLHSSHSDFQQGTVRPLPMSAVYNKQQFISQFASLHHLSTQPALIHQLLTTRLPNMFVEYWILYDDFNQPIACAAANTVISDMSVGYVGLFEAKDELAGISVLKAATAWLRGGGLQEFEPVRQILGPVNLTTWLQYRIRVDEDPAQSMSFEPRHPRFYQSCFEKAGFTKAVDYYTTFFEIDQLIHGYSSYVGRDTVEDLGLSLQYWNTLNFAASLVPERHPGLTDEDNVARRVYDLSIELFRGKELFDESLSRNHHRQLVLNDMISRPEVDNSSLLDLSSFLRDPRTGEDLGYLACWIENGTTLVLKTVGYVEKVRKTKVFAMAVLETLKRARDHWGCSKVACALMNESSAGLSERVGGESIRHVYRLYYHQLSDPSSVHNASSSSSSNNNNTSFTDDSLKDLWLDFERHNDSAQDELYLYPLCYDNNNNNSTYSFMAYFVRQLEEISRLKAQLEARVLEKQRKKAMAKASSSSDTQVAPLPSKEGLTDGVREGKTEPSSAPIEVNPFMETTPAPEQGKQRAISGLKSKRPVTTPPTVGTPLISPGYHIPVRDPGFRTPSPPPRSRYDNSPSSGAYTRSKKRQHSPSPLPRQAPMSAQLVRRPVAVPVSEARRLFADHTGTANAPNATSQPVSSPQSASSSQSLQPLRPTGTSTSTPSKLDDFEDFEFENFPSDDDFDVLSPVKPKVVPPTVFEDDPFNPVEPVKKAPVVAATSRPPGGKSTAVRNITAPSQAPRGMATTSAITTASDIVDTDPVSGLRILHRVVPKEELAQLTQSARIIPLKNYEQIREKCNRPTIGSAPSYSKQDENKENWGLTGVIGAKSKPRKTAQNTVHSLFRLCDLSGAIVNLFMFKPVMDVHYSKLQVGDVVVVLNPDVLTQADRSGPVGIKVQQPEGIFRIGKSKDYGLCEAVKLNNENCGLMVDRRASIYCTHHIMTATDKQRNQRGSLIAGTSSIYDLEKKRPGVHTASSTMPIRIGGPQHTARRKIMDPASTKDTTYIFDNGSTGSSSMTQPTKKTRTNEPVDDDLSLFLMSQNNPGGQYLRQAKSSGDVTLAKELTSPKRSTTPKEMFPAEMVRRMGYDPVTGQFVPGSPQRGQDDPEARERSIRMLAERVKSPPSGGRIRDFMGKGKILTPTKRKLDFGQPDVASKSAKLPSGREVSGSVFFDDAEDAPEKDKGGETKRWIDLDDGSSSSGSDEEGRGQSPLLSLQEKRALNLRNASLSKKLAASSTSTASPVKATTTVPLQKTLPSKSEPKE